MDSPSFEKILESDIQQLAAEIRGQHDRPETQNIPERQIIKEAIRAFPEFNHASPKGNGVAADTPIAAGDPTSPLPAYAQTAPAETKLEIEYLLDLALKKGIGAALTESQKSTAFVQDAFHDALAGRLYPELQKRGVVK
jgi:hypothetical protein